MSLLLLTQGRKSNLLYPLILGFRSDTEAKVVIGSKTTENVYIDWGDGEDTIVEDPGVYTHTFDVDLETAPPVIEVQVSGGLVSLGADPTDVESNPSLKTQVTNPGLVSVISFGNIPSFYQVRFQYCANLVSMPASLPNTFRSLSGLVQGCTSFDDSSLSDWGTDLIQDLSYAFYGATAFNRPIDEWVVSSVSSMSYMLYDASSFTQDLSLWCVSLIPSLPTGFGSGAGAFTPPVWGTCPVRLAPQITSDPTITGTPMVGETLTAVPGTSNSAVPTPFLSWQWLRDALEIDGATGDQYILVEDDAGQSVRVRQTLSNTEGYDSRLSASVTVV